ncbi:MAG: DUF4159 domain-containing protein [Acidobacteria bacterium]|nr:DUF4159 domain-containing protein [Acidobacteriota bacterium]
MTRMRGGRSFLILAIMAIATVASAQFRFDRPFQGFRGWRVPPRLARPGDFNGSYNFCRGMFESDRWEAGGQGWSTDYPAADVNFSIRLAELTKTSVHFDAAGQPKHVVVRLTDDAFFKCPMVEMEDVGTMMLSEEEVTRLRDYLLKGGFIWVDDFWGTDAWEHWTEQIARVLPPADYPIVDLLPPHPLYRTLFELQRIPQIPSIQSWRRLGGGTSERGSDSAEVHFRGIMDHAGRVMVLMSHNTDISDAWEREGEDPEFFYSFSPQGYAVGINVLMYAMTH